MYERIPEHPPEAAIACYCGYCGGEIYEGEEIYDVDGDTIHEDCLLAYARENLAVKREVCLHD